jgi:hypothetical protein
MEKRKTIWFSVPISTLIQAAEEHSSIKIQFSHDELMEQILDDNSSDSFLSTKNIFDFMGKADSQQERLTVIKCRFGQSFLKELIEKKKGYTSSLSWKDALLLALDKTHWSLNIPANSRDEEEEEENDTDETVA